MPLTIEEKKILAIATSRAATAHTHDASALATGTIDTARLGSGTADATTYLRGDQSWSPLILENRTSDPGSPAVGQMWLRTDL